MRLSVRKASAVVANSGLMNTVAFKASASAAGVKNWNVTVSNVYDPVVKAGLGAVVEFQDFIPHRIRGQVSDATLEKTLAIFEKMRADNAKAYQIKNTLAPIFIEEAKAIEAARTDAVPRVRRENRALSSPYYLYMGPPPKMTGSSPIEGHRMLNTASWINLVERHPPVVSLHGHFKDIGSPLNPDQGCIEDVLSKDRVWPHTGEPILEAVHGAWAGEFFFEGEDAAGQTVRIPIQAPVPATVETVQADGETAVTTVTPASSGITEAGFITNDAGFPRFSLGPVYGWLQGAGTPSQQGAEYAANAAVLDKFNGFQSLVAIKPATVNTITDLSPFSPRNAAKFNTQTLYGRSNYVKMVFTMVFFLLVSNV